jgi:hypothetical protein
MTFHVSGARREFNPYDWLPTTGEDGLEFRSEGMDVVVEIFFQPDGGGKRQKRELRFFNVSSFRKESFHGPSIPTGVSFEDNGVHEMLGSLVQFEHSDVADAWTASLEGRRHVKHYVMNFLSEQVYIGAFSTGYELGQETDA